MLTRVADGVLVHRSALLRNDTVVVAVRSGVLVVDAGITDGETACLARDLAAAGQRVVAGSSTQPDREPAAPGPALSSGDASTGRGGGGTVSYLERLRQERPALYWLVLLVGFWLGFQVLLVVAQLLLGPFALPAWAPLALVLGLLVFIARRQSSR